MPVKAHLTGVQIISMAFGTVWPCCVQGFGTFASYPLAAPRRYSFGYCLFRHALLLDLLEIDAKRFHVPRDLIVTANGFLQDAVTPSRAGLPVVIVGAGQLQCPLDGPRQSAAVAERPSTLRVENIGVDAWSIACKNRINRYPDYFAGFALLDANRAVANVIPLHGNHIRLTLACVEQAKSATTCR